MARTEIAVTNLGPFAKSGVTLTGTTGDDTNDHEIDGDSVPRLHLLCSNAHTSTVDFAILAASNSRTGVRGATIAAVTSTVPAAAAGIEGKRLVVLDAHALLQDGDGVATNAILINSSDANLNLCTFYAFTWTPTSVT
ncbi:MAG: hypothetical protein GWN29_04920 [Gammaproteobacteria bacterium]|nr:hypothetical protein [Gammaproteobacteria bacterium]NIV51096.1 hypothetical protein [Gammaproteobacteria bacterium]NIW23948.1 hypothetical protein [Gammaproteobacteria bacterium]NIX85038.1 hypothetical protein [Gammaproteobacteria bacterium]